MSRKFFVQFLVIGILLYLLFFQIPAWWNANKCWNAIPNTTALLLEFDTAVDIQATLGDLMELYPLQQLQEDRAYLDSLGLENEQLIAVLQANTPETFNWLFILESDIDLQKALSNYTYTTSILHDTPVYSIADKFAVAQAGDVLLYAPYALQVEQAIEQLQNRKSLWRNKHLRRLQRTSSGGVACYFSLANMPSFLAPYLRPQQRATVQQLQHIRDWLRLDIQRDSMSLQLSGQWKAETRAARKLLYTPKNEAKILNVLPDHTAFYVWGNLKTWLETQELTQLNTLWEHSSDEAATAFLEAHSDTPSRNKLLFVRLQNEKAALESLSQLAQLGNIQASPYQMFQYYIIRDSDWSFTRIQDYLIFSKNTDLLQTYLDKYIAGQVLANDIDFMRSVTAEGTNTTAAFYAHPQRLLPYLQMLFRAEYTPTIQQNIQDLREIKGIHMTADKEGLLKGRIAQSEMLENTSIVWKTALTKNAIIAPQLVSWNGEKRILIQDASYQLYCLDASGQIRWTKPLQGRVLSDFQAIRFFNDARQQYFFNTDKNIHLIDELGHAVGAFPMRLQSPATNGMRVVDFDRTGFYDFFVACANGNVYGFDQTGRPLEAWSPKAIGEVHHAIEHFQWQNKDFISILSQEGKLHMLKRDASPRFPAYKLKHPQNAMLSYQATGDFPRIIVADNQGTVHVLHPRGESFTLPLEIGKNKHVKHAFADVWGDARKDYIVTSGQKLAIYAYDEKGFKKQFGGKFEYAQDTVFAIPTATKARVGLLCKAREQIILFNEEQRPATGFPLAGTTPFVLDDLFEESEEILIVGNRNSVYAYRLSD